MTLVTHGLIDLGRTQNQRDFKRKSIQPALTKTCRQIRTETITIFYGGNVFLTDANKNCIKTVTWVQFIGPKNRSRLKRLYLDCYHTGDLTLLFKAVEEKVCMQTVAPEGELLEMLSRAGALFVAGTRILHMTFG